MPLARYHQLLNLLGTSCLLVLLAACSFSAGTSHVAPSKKSSPLMPASASIPLGTTFYIYRGHSSSVFGVAWSPDGKRIASASLDGTVQVWDDTTGNHALIYRGHAGPVFSAAWSPNGKQIASGGYDKTVQIWDASTGKHVLTYRGHAALVNGVSWSLDGKRIASASDDGTVQIWDAR